MNTLLKITGQVAQPLDLSLADFRQFGDEHQVADMSEIDPRRVGRAVSLDVLLERAQVLSTAKRLKLIGSADGYESVVPLEPLVGRGLVIYEVEGESLTAQAGGPTRFYIRDHTDCNLSDLDACANVKFLDGIEVLD